MSSLTPYRKGLLAATVLNSNTFIECPYDPISDECTEWWKGYCIEIKVLILEKKSLYLEHK